MWQWIRRRAYRKLGPALIERYGRAPTFTVAQVTTTVGVLELDTSYLELAIAAWCERAAFDQFAEIDDARWQQLRLRARRYGIGPARDAGSTDIDDATFTPTSIGFDNDPN